MRNEVGDTLVVESDQATDNFLRSALDTHVLARLLSCRCQEARNLGLPNQDYAKIVSQRNNSSLSFCVCDGVGSSYKGDFAAYYLATYLVQWLQGLNGLQHDSQTLSTILQSQLNQLARSARVELREVALPMQTPYLVREVLEELRDKHGSETVFLCGRIDHGSWATPLAASRPMQALFCWMGNIRARLFVSADQYIELGDQEDNEGRWSTKFGCRGTLKIWDFALTTLERLIVHTDGLDAIGTTLVNLDDEQWQTQTQELLKRPANDDMTALDLQWWHGQYGQS